MPEEVRDNEVGERLRRIRLGRRLTLKTVAAEAEITEGFLSQIETGRSAPSLKTFRRIAEALGMTPSDVLDAQDAPLPHFVPRQGGRPLAIGAVSKFRVTPPSMTSMEILRGDLEVGGSTGEGYTHGDSEESISILLGSVIVTIDGAPFPMEAGDVLCYRSSMGHSVRNVGDGPASVLWFVAPPTTAISH
jgi:DNA-binding XRE family transcriptional regulator/quercetin dioxygenase-like cupin family protein